MILVGGAVALWTASGVANALMRALNRVYDTDESRGFVRQRLVGLVMVAVGVTSPSCSCSGCSSWVRSCPAGSESLVGAEGAVRWAWLLGQWPILLVGLLVAFGAVLFLGPDVEHPRWSFLSGGPASPWRSGWSPRAASRSTWRSSAPTTRRGGRSLR